MTQLEQLAAVVGELATACRDESRLNTKRHRELVDSIDKLSTSINGLTQALQTKVVKKVEDQERDLRAHLQAPMAVAHGR